MYSLLACISSLLNFHILQLNLSTFCLVLPASSFSSVVCCCCLLCNYIMIITFNLLLFYTFSIIKHIIIHMTIMMIFSINSYTQLQQEFLFFFGSVVCSCCCCLFNNAQTCRRYTFMASWLLD